MSEATDSGLPLRRAFGAESRRELLAGYFATSGPVSPANAWKHVYRLLLWIDRTTSLAHCYESDKSQPGRPWYARTLAFHDWVSTELGTAPSGLQHEIDWLFTQGSERLARIIAQQQAQRSLLAEGQRKPYAHRNFPAPGDDPIFREMLLEELGEWLRAEPSPEVIQRLAWRIRSHLAHENKRKNLVGEGFEDVLAFLLNQLPGNEGLAVKTRPLLQTVPGFRPPPKGEKVRKVDIVVLSKSQRRTLVSAKWSVRADREEQFGVDFEAYARLESEGQDFDFVLVTNEFDAARLAAACERRRQNAFLFSSVVHVNPEGPLTAYRSDSRGAAKRLHEHVASGRLASLEGWLSHLTGPENFEG